MLQWVKAYAAKPDSLSSNPCYPHDGRREPTPQLSSEFHICTMAHVYTHTYTQNNILKEQSNDILLTILTPGYSIKNVTAGHSTTGLWSKLGVDNCETA